MSTEHVDEVGCYETYLYEVGGGRVETCEHQHPTLESAWGCAEMCDPEDPFDVVWVNPQGGVEYTCRRREDENE